MSGAGDYRWQVVEVEIDPEDLVGIGAAARALGVHSNTVRNWAKRGRIGVVFMPGGGFRKIPASEVERVRGQIDAQLERKLAPPPPVGIDRERHLGVVNRLLDMCYGEERARIRSELVSVLAEMRAVERRIPPAESWADRIEQVLSDG